MAAEIARKIANTMRGPAVRPPPGVTLRRATKDDLEGIKRLTRNSFGGIDFLPFHFLEFMEDPDRYIYVALKDGRVIACTYHYVIDGGRTINAGGGRRDPAFRQQGVYKALAHYALVSTLTVKPSLVRMRSSSPNVEFQRNRIAGDPRYRFLPKSSMAVVTMAKTVPSEHFAVITTPAFAAQLATLGVNNEQVRFASRSDIEKIFTNQFLKEKVFPGDFFGMGPDTFQPRVENLSAIFKGYRAFTISDCGLSLGVSQLRLAEIGFFFDVKLYGELSAKVAMAHFLKLAEKVQRHCPADQRISCLCYVPEAVPKEEFTFLCGKLPFYSKERGLAFDRFVFFEEIIPKPNVSSL